MKRFTSLSHYVLGVALSIAPMGAYVAVTGRLDAAPFFLSLMVFFWVSGFDIIYALSDANFDKEHSLHSVPQYFGIKNALKISSLGHLLVVPFIFLFFFAVNNNLQNPLLGPIYGIGSFLFLALLLWQHLIVSPKDLSRVDAAFFTANGVASALFALFAIIDLVF